MKIKIELEIDIKKIVEEDFASIDNEILKFSVQDICDSINFYYNDDIMSYADDETLSKVSNEYLRIAREKVGATQLSLFDAETR